MRKVIAARVAPCFASAATTQRRNCARVGSAGSSTAYCTARDNRGAARSGFFDSVFVRFVGMDDALHQGMAHHVFGLEYGKGDAAHRGENPARFNEPAFLSAPKIDLGDVTGDHRLGAEADAG